MNIEYDINTALFLNIEQAFAFIKQHTKNKYKNRTVAFIKQHTINKPKTGQLLS